MKKQDHLYSLKNFDIYSRALIVSKDVDPIYPWLKSFLYKNEDIDPKWFILVYVMFYSLESAIKFTKLWPTPATFDQKSFLKMRENGSIKKFGHERRGRSRNPEVQLEMLNNFYHLLQHIEVETSILSDNLTFRTAIETMPHHGGWASFKIAELFEKVLEYSSLEIPDLGLKGRDPNSNDGPVGGLRWLFGKDYLYNNSQYWFSVWNEFGKALANGWGVDMGKVETCLCKWHKMCSGKYYIGHDIEEICELRGEVLNEVDFGEYMLLSEFNPAFWEDEKIKGVNKERKKLFLKEGLIFSGWFSDSLPSVDVEQIIMNL